MKAYWASKEAEKAKPQKDGTPMPPRSQYETGELLTWAEIESQHAWTNLVVANGLSINICSDFRYPSLYDIAKDPSTPNALSDEDVAIFSALNDTTSFEEVLGALDVTRRVQFARGKRIASLTRRYRSIRRALIAAVHARHIPWDDLIAPTDRLLVLAERLRRYRRIFTLNYDLLIYWALMRHNTQRDVTDFKDFFWANPFDVTQTDARPGSSLVYFVHGALHLYRTKSGLTKKRVRGEFSSLLDSFGSTGIPLFVSEGTSEEKNRAIQRSGYLSFAYQSLKQMDGPTVLFGSSLSDSDAHVAAALRTSQANLIAVSMRQDTPNRLKERMHAVAQRLTPKPLYFFDSSTHPLGAADLHVR